MYRNHWLQHYRTVSTAARHSGNVVLWNVQVAAFSWTSTFTSLQCYCWLRIKEWFNTLSHTPSTVQECWINGASVLLTFFFWKYFIYCQSALWREKKVWWNSSCDQALQSFYLISEASYYQFLKYKRCCLSLLEQKLTVTTSLFEIHPCQCLKGEGDSNLCSGC